jgi:hypothetical protein
MRQQRASTQGALLALLVEGGKAVLRGVLSLGGIFHLCSTLPVQMQLQVEECGNEEENEAAAEQAASDTPDDMTCAICLERTPITDIALIKGCEHQYCGMCQQRSLLCSCPSHMRAIVHDASAVHW